QQSSKDPQVPPIANQQDSRKQLIADLKFKDPALKKCVDAMVSQHNWKTVGEFVALDCNGTQKARLFFGDSLIKDLAGLEQLIALKKLSIPGHGYSSIDVSALKELEELNLYEAFVRTLDLGRNTHLRYLNVGATAIDDLNLMGLKDLKILIAAYDGQGFHDVYTPSAYNCYGPSYGISLEEVQNQQKNIRLDPAVQLANVDLGNNGVIDLPDATALVSARGRINASSLQGAQNTLETLDINIDGIARLDLSQYKKLYGIKVLSTQVRSISIPLAAKTLNFSGPIDDLIIPGEGQLTDLTLEGVSALSPLDLKVPKNLERIYINNIALKTVDFAHLTSLSSLMLTKVGMESLNLPNAPMVLQIVEPRAPEGQISNLSAVKYFELYKSNSMYCHLDWVSFAALESLGISGCPGDALSSVGLTDLTSARRVMPNLINFSVY
ncbi:MAG TPA: hypothetical protein PK129_02195, partial [Cellvibrionaceae bacterium]|nr:hypothetical protein [Cellvibrionaceae bacterium]